MLTEQRNLALSVGLVDLGISGAALVEQHTVVMCRGELSADDVRPRATPACLHGEREEARRHICPIRCIEHETGWSATVADHEGIQARPAGCVNDHAASRRSS